MKLPQEINWPDFTEGILTVVIVGLPLLAGLSFRKKKKVNKK
jgi:hypothetical protein